MCGRAYSPRQLWMWPNARISVMGGPQAASVLSTVKGEMTPEAKAEFEAPILEKYEREAARTIPRAPVDDGRHRSARHAPRAGHRLEAAANAPQERTHFGIFRM